MSLSPLHAATLNWTGSASNAWFNAANWSPAQIPSSADDVVIDLNAIVSASGGTSIAFATLALGDASGNFSPTLRLSAAGSTSGSVTIHRGAKLQQDTSQQVVFGSLTVMPGGMLTHTANTSSRSFLINMSVAGDFDLQAGATIAANGLGYTGGSGYTVPGNGPGGGTANSGVGAGGAHGGAGGKSSSADAGGAGYDNATNPTDLGSGGGGSYPSGPGGAGGGAVLIVVGGTFSLNGQINANGNIGSVSGQNYGSGSGAGGTVNITATAFNGTGQILANGAAGATGGNYGGGGAGGRIAVVVTGNDASNLTLQARSGAGGGGAATGGGAGVIARKGPGASLYRLTIGEPSVTAQSITSIAGAAPVYSDVTITNSIVNFDAGSTATIGGLVIMGTATVTAAKLAPNTLEVASGAVLQLTAQTTGGSLQVDAGGIFRQMNAVPLGFASVSILTGGALTHAANSTARASVVNLNVSGNFDLQSGAVISASGLGYTGGSGYTVPGNGPGGGTANSGVGAGGAHGGAGGKSSANDAGGAGYDNATNPTDLGSGGGGSYPSGPGGAGGGAVLISVGGTFSLNGQIIANGNIGTVSGQNYGSGSGAGGAVNITATDFNGTGSVLANGATGATGGNFGGGGAGGRIAVVVTGTDASNLTLQARRGASGGGAATGGGAGVIARKGPGASLYSLTIGEPSVTAQSITPISGALPIFADVALTNSIVNFDSGSTATIGGLVIIGTVTVTAARLSPSTLEVSNGAVLLLTAQATGGSLQVDAGGIFRQMNTLPLSFTSVSVLPGGVLTHGANSTARSYLVNLNVSGNFDLQAGAVIAVGGLGYAGGAGYQASGSGPGGGLSSSGVGGGGAHGGAGGKSSVNDAGGAAYDSVTNPLNLGSGGAGSYTNGVGGAGGGAVLIAVGGAFSLNGQINANGGTGTASSQNYGAGGGAGGTVNLTAGSFNGTGAVLANGAAGVTAANFGGGGGGGIVALTGCNSYLVASGVNGGAAGGTGATAGGTGNITRAITASCPPPPPYPSDLAVTNAGLNSLTVVWSSTVAVISYTLQVSTDPTFTTGTISTTTVVSSITVSGLLSRTAYYLRVLAINASGSSPYSPSISAQTLTIPANINWVGGANSDWFNRANWSPGLIPNSADTVAIDANAVVVIGASSTASFSSLVLGNLAGGTTPTLKVSGTIATSGSLVVNRNATLQQDTLQQLTLGQITVAAGGAISADGGGFAPGTGPGAGLSVPENFGGGNGSGGGYAGHGGGGSLGGNGDPQTLGGIVYGSLSQPAELGSGGGGITSGANVVVPGGRGGGRINISAGTLHVDGRISADGQTGAENGYWGDRAGGGSGGTVLITAQQLEGTGVISANGGASSPRGFKNGGGGGGGRVKISYETSVFAGTVAARGGVGRKIGGAGTVVYGTELRIDNGISGASTTILAGTYGFQRVSIGSNALVEMEAGAALNVESFLTQGGGTFTNRGSLTATTEIAAAGASVLRHLAGSLSSPRLAARTGGLFSYEGGRLSAQEAETASGGALSVNARLELARMLVASGGVVTHAPGDADFDLAVSQTLTIEPGGRISADGVGFGPSAGPGAGLTVPENFGGGRGSGGGYGGYGGGGNLGGNGDPQTLGGAVYGSMSQPSELGSGGGSITGGHGVLLVLGGRGGGRLRIDAGTLRVDGRISADGQTGAENGYYGDRAGGGSGGSVLITARQFEGTGVISANGGASSPRGLLSAGGGGGGRIALYYTTKVGSHTLIVNGGIGSRNGFPGTILDNGTLYGTVAGSSATLAFSQMQEKLAATKTLGETLSAQLLSFSGATSTGIPTGTFSLAELRVVMVKTGPFTNKGFFRGRYTLSIPAGETLSGEWEGMAFFTADDPQHLFLKGALKGRIVGVLDGSLTEATAGSGVFDRLTATCRLVQVGDAMGASTIYVSGNGSVIETAQYPGTTLNFLQATQAGEVGGYYSTPADIAFSLLRVDNPGNPYHGEGFFAANYDSPLGSGQGWAYAAVSGDSARLAGPFEQSLKGLMEGALTLDSPRSLLLTLRNLDDGLPLQAEVTTSLATAGNTPIGGVATVIIEVRNDGYAVAEGVTVVAVAPEKSRFLSATGDYRTYDVTHWRNSEYTPKPFIRWDFAAVPARSSQKMSYQVRLPPATPSSVQAGIDVRAITTAWANTIFANYHLGETP